MSKKRRSPRQPLRTQASIQPAAVPSSPRLWERRWFPVAVFAMLSLAYFHELPFTDNVVYGSDTGTDFHRGARLSVWEKAQTLLQPRWSPQVGGYPQYEEIRHQYFPTRLVYFFTTYQRHLAWRYIITMFAAGLGMYAYLRALRIGPWPALWAGVAYMSAPTFLTFTLAGHYAKMAVIALLPTMFLMLERGMNTGRAAHFAGLAVLIAMSVYSPHLQMLYFALWALGFYFLYKLAVSYRQTRALDVAAARTGLFTVAVVLGLGIGAEGLFPSFLYTKTESKRAAADDGGGRTEEEQLAFARSWPLHPEEIGSLVVPEFGGFVDFKEGDHYWGRNAFKLNSENFGTLTLILALSVVPLMRRRSLLLFMGLLFAFALCFALAPYTPVHWLFFKLAPGASVLRAAGMIAFLFAFPACVAAAFGLQRIIAADEEATRPLLVAGGGVLGVAALLAIAPAAMTDTWIGLFYDGIEAAKRQILIDSYPWLARGAGYVSLIAAAAMTLMYLRLRRHLSTELLVAGLVLLTLVDTWRIDKVFLRYVDAGRFADSRDENPRVVEFLRKQDGLFRILPLPDPKPYGTLKLPGMHLHGITTVTGQHDFTPRRYDRMLEELWPLQNLLEARTRGQQVEHSDTVLLNAFRPLMNLLNARYLVTPRNVELQAAGFPQILAADNFRVYENASALPWLYLAGGASVVEEAETALMQVKEGGVNPRHTVLLEKAPPVALGLMSSGAVSNGRVQRLEYDLDDGVMRLQTEADAATVLVVSENFHPYWRASVDGAEVEVYRANYVWMGVPLSSGRHVVELRYESTAVSLSRVAVLLSLLGVAGLWVWDYRQRRPQKPAPDPGEEAQPSA